MSDETSGTVEILEIGNFSQQQSIGTSLVPPVLSLENRNTSTSVTLGDTSKSCILISGNVYGSSLQILTPRQCSMAESGEICAICLNNFASEWGDVHTIKKCKHQFHEECIHRWKKEQERCPLCRGPLVDELRVIQLLEKIRRMNLRMAIFRFLPLENENPLSTIEKATNIILSPFGLAWVALTIPLLMTLEIICISLSLLVFLLLFSGVVCSDCLTNCYEIFSMLDIFITLMIVGIMFLPYAIILHILLMIWIAINFCLLVLRFERRWQDAFLHITRRTIFESFYYLL